MLDSINNFSSMINDFSRGIDPYGASVYMKGNNTLQRSPQTDTVAVGNKQPKKLSTGAKVGIGIGATAAAILGAVLGHKAISAYQMSKVIKAIDAKFSVLESDLPKVQNTFKDVFMRDDLTLEQTKQMLNEYKQLAYKRVDKNVSAEDYAKSLFETATKNYGLEHAGIKLEFKPLNDTKAGGLWNMIGNKVVLGDKSSKNFIFGALHHELRHAKQSQAIFESLTGTEIDEHIVNKAYEQMKRYQNMDNIDMETFKKEFCTPDVIEAAKKTLSGKLCRKGIKPSEKEVEYAKKMSEAQINYVDLDTNEALYWTNGLEQDARHAETTMNELFGLNNSRTSWYKQMDEKYLAQKAA